MEEDKAYIAKKLGLTVEEFQTIIDGENKTFRDYRNSWGLIQFGTVVLRALGVVAEISAWIVGPSRALRDTAQDVYKRQALHRPVDHRHPRAAHLPEARHPFPRRAHHQGA